MTLQEKVKQHLAQEFGLPDEDVEELLASARETVEYSLSKLALHVDDRDFQAVAVVSHTLKGNFLNMGLDEVAGLARHLEETAREGRDREMERCYTLLQQELTPFLD